MYNVQLDLIRINEMKRYRALPYQRTGFADCFIRHTSDKADNAASSRETKCYASPVRVGRKRIKETSDRPS